MPMQVKKGRYPGGPKPLIFSEKIINGGASNREVEALLRKQNGAVVEKKKSQRRSSRARSYDSSTDEGYETHRRNGQIRATGYDGASAATHTGYVRPTQRSSFRSGGVKPHLG